MYLLSMACWCVSVCTRMCSLQCMADAHGSQMLMLGVFLYCSPLIFETGSLTELTILARQAGQQTFRILLSLPPRAGRTDAPALHPAPTAKTSISSPLLHILLKPCWKSSSSRKLPLAHSAHRFFLLDSQKSSFLLRIASALSLVIFLGGRGEISSVYCYNLKEIRLICRSGVKPQGCLFWVEDLEKWLHLLNITPTSIKWANNWSCLVWQEEESCLA